jgi:hypothetical protein
MLCGGGTMNDNKQIEKHKAIDPENRRCGTQM